MLFFLFIFIVIYLFVYLLIYLFIYLFALYEKKTITVSKFCFLCLFCSILSLTENLPAVVNIKRKMLDQNTVFIVANLDTKHLFLKKFIDEKGSLIFRLHRCMIISLIIQNNIQATLQGGAMVRDGVIKLLINWSSRYSLGLQQH